MNTFFCNIVINLNVPEYHDCEGIYGSISDPILRAIKRVSNSSGLFSFDIVDREKILEEISSLDHTKACQKSDAPIKNY